MRWSPRLWAVRHRVNLLSGTAGLMVLRLSDPIIGGRVEAVLRCRTGLQRVPPGDNMM